MTNIWRIYGRRPMVGRYAADIWQTYGRHASCGGNAPVRIADIRRTCAILMPTPSGRHNFQGLQFAIYVLVS